MKVRERVMAKCMQSCHNAIMPVQITIRNVPDSVRAELAARAALEGKSMQEYLRGELERLAARPSKHDWLRNVRDRKRAASTRIPAELILEQRDADRR